MAVAMTGKDTISISGTILNDLADANCVELTFPNEISTVKIGKNGNAIYGLNTQGQLAEVKLRVIRASSDDQYLNGLLSAQQNAYAQTTLLTGEFIKNVGDGNGNVAGDTYILGGGVFIKWPEAKSNVEGDSEQSIAMYTLRFANSPIVRAIT